MARCDSCGKTYSDERPRCPYCESAERTQTPHVDADIAEPTGSRKYAAACALLVIAGSGILSCIFALIYVMIKNF